MPPPVARGSVTSKEGPVSDDIHQALYDKALANRTVVAPRRSIEGRIQRTLADPSKLYDLIDQESTNSGGGASDDGSEGEAGEDEARVRFEDEASEDEDS